MEAQRNSPISSARHAVVLTAGGRRHLGQGGDRHGVPLGQHLLVAGGLHPLGAGGRQQEAGLLHLGRARQRCPDRADRDGPALPVAAGRDPVPLGRRAHQGGRQDLAQFLDGEGGVRAFDAARVGVERRVQRALGRREVPQHEVQRLGDHAEVLGPPAVLPCMQVGTGQLRLVGEHLLEVRDEPVRVGRVAAEPADEVVVDAACRHGVERAQPHLPGVVGVGAAAVGTPQAEIDEGRTRELRGRSETAPLGIETDRDAGDHLFDEGLGVEAHLGCAGQS